MLTLLSGCNAGTTLFDVANRIPLPIKFAPTNPGDLKINPAKIAAIDARSLRQPCAHISHLNISLSTMFLAASRADGGGKEACLELKAALAAIEYPRNFEQRRYRPILLRSITAAPLR